MSNLIKRYLVRPVSSLTAFIVMVLMIPLSIVMMLLLSVASLAVLSRLRNAKPVVLNEYRTVAGRRQNTHKQDKDTDGKPPIEGKYTVVNS